MSSDPWWPLTWGSILPKTNGRIARFTLHGRDGQVSEFEDGSFKVFLYARNELEVMNQPTWTVHSLLELRATLREIAAEIGA